MVVGICLVTMEHPGHQVTGESHGIENGQLQEATMCMRCNIHFYGIIFKEMSVPWL